MKGCLGVALAIAGALVVAGFGLFKWIQNYSENFPEYAKPDAVYAHYGTLVADLQLEVEASHSLYDLAARFEKVSYPDELIYLILLKENDDRFNDEKLEIIEKFDVTSTSHTIINGTGHGKVNGAPVVVIDLPIDRHGIKNGILYFKRDEAPASTDIRTP